MKIESVKIVELKAAEYNPRQLSKDQFKSLRESLDKFGFVDPVVANKRNNVIIGGHQRVKVWQDLGNEMVPVFWVDLEPEDEKRLNVTLNAVTGDWDFDILANFFEVDDLEAWGFDMDLLPMLDEEKPKKEKNTEQSFKVMVVCKTEKERLQCVELLEKSGYDASAM